MSKINLKRFIPISILAVLLVAVSAITYSIATNSNNNAAIGEKSISDVEQLGSSEPGFTYISNIDLIIENANDNNKTFNIVEIVPQGATNSDLKTYVDNAGFKNYVIDANSEKNATMKADMITYVCVSVNPTTALTDKVASHQVAVGTATTVGESKTMQNLLDEADLVYVSTPAYTSYDGDCNMSDEIYNYLRSYARGNDKPIIMDYVTKSTSVSTTENKTMGDLVNVVSKNHIRYRTFCWDKDVTAANFFARKGSYYLSFNTNKETATGKFLILSTNNTGSDILAKLKGMDADTDRTNLKAAAYSGTNTSSFSITDSSFTVMIVEDNKLLLDGTEVGASALDGYDFIIIEQDTPSIKISNDVYNKLKSLSESSKHILYDSRALTSSSSDNTSNEVAIGANNYLNLMDYLISNKGEARYDNVLAVSYGYFTSLNIAGESGLSSAKNVADIIDGTNYRENSGGNGTTGGTVGSNRKVFRVLELQPCYPIDLSVAKSKKESGENKGQNRFLFEGNYYEEPSEVLFNKTADEVLEGTEYYAFELSKAKIAKATGLKMEQIELDQMSTDELISKKDVLMDTYDLIYVGGNKSALMPYEYRDYTPEYTLSMNSHMYELNTSFDMYTHTGTYVQLKTYMINDNKAMVAYYGGMIDVFRQTDPGKSDAMPYGTVSTINADGTYTAQVTSVALNGNDINQIKLDELKNYMDAGMPIIIEQTVASAFEKTYEVRTNRLEQLALNEIDPDSFMYDFLEYAYTSASSKQNILWKLQMTETLTETSTESSVTETAESEVAALAMSDVEALAADETNIDSTNEDTTTELVDSTADEEVTDDGSSITVKIDNSDKRYGDTITDQVTVFNSSINTKIYDLVYTKSKVRPVLTITNQPYDYVEGNEETYNEGKTLSISFYVTPVGKNAVTDYDVTLYIDKNENGIFGDANDISTTKTYSYSASSGSPKTETISYSLGNDYFGMVSWKLVAKEKSSGDSATVGVAASGYPFFKRGDAPKKEVRVLQIMPKNVYYDYTLNTGKSVEESTPREIQKYYEEKYQKNDGHSLYLCTECQHVGYPIDYNIYTNMDNGQPTYYNSYGHWQSTYVKNSKTGETTILNLGRHEHKFGIVQYDTTTQDEDWETNLADVLSDDYDFDIDIMWADDLDELVEESKSFSETGLIEYKGQQVTPAQALSLAKDALEEAETTFNNQAPAIETDLGNLLKLLAEEGYYANEYFDKFAEKKEFYKFFFYNSGSIRDKSADSPGYVSDTFYKYVLKYNEYVAIKDPLIEAQETVKEYEKKAATVENWLNNNYSIVVLGYADDFGGRDLSVDSCNLLKQYVSNGGYMLNTHDTTTRYAQMGAINITTQLRSMFGMDRFHINNYDDYVITTTESYTYGDFPTARYLLADTESKDSSDKLLKDQRYETVNASKYFWTERIKIGDSYGNVARAQWQEGMSVSSIVGAWDKFGFTSPVGLTDAAMLFDTQNYNSSPYKYVTYKMQDAIHWNNAVNEYAENNGKYYGTDGASRVNRGIVTEYPFTISSELRIAGTHAQTYALDMEDEDVAVWYTLSAGSSKSRASAASLYAASPRDGMDAYYLYSHVYNDVNPNGGIVYYCGAGHTVVTGPKRNNNDERKLFINIICTSGKSGMNGIQDPEITVHEKDTNGAVIDENKKDGNLFIENGNYYYNVNSNEEAPEFDFKVKVDETTTLGEVLVYYDLNYNDTSVDITGMDKSNDYTDDKNHVLIAAYNSLDDSINLGQLLNGQLAKLRENDLSKLKLHPEYFEPYGGSYTYIVIKAVDGAGNITYKRIKIKLIPELFDLTLNSNNVHYFFTMDLYDKTKFNI